MTEPDLRARPGIATEGRNISQPPDRRSRFMPFGRRSSVDKQGQGVPRENRRSQGVGILRALKHVWIPLVILAVVIAGGVTVTRLHGIFGSEKRPSYADTRQQDTKPFNPKRVQYQIFGPPGTTADISYFDVNGEPQHINGIPLPWTYDIATTLPSIVANVVAQGNSDTLGCRIVVDGAVKAERISHELNAFTYCVLTAT